MRLGAFNGLQLIVTGDLHIPTIVVSGFDDAVLQADARAFGAEYLVKPVTAASLLDLIDQKLGRSSAVSNPEHTDSGQPPLVSFGSVSGGTDISSSGFGSSGTGSRMCRRGQVIRVASGVLPSLSFFPPNSRK